MNSSPMRQPNLRLRRHLRFHVLTCAFGLVFLFAAATAAQGIGGIESSGTGGRNTINGRIYFPSGRRNDTGLRIRLESSNSGRLSVFSDSNGSFSFRNLEPGNYSILIEGGDEYENAHETVYIDDTRGLSPGASSDIPRTYTLPIYLQLKKNAAKSEKASVVSAELASVPENARSLYTTAMTAIQAGDNAKGIDNLRAAIAIFPVFSLALNELGVQYLKLGQSAKAIEPLKAAVNLSPAAFSPRLNFGFALLEARHFVESEIQLKEAVKLNGTSAIAHMYLGLATINQHKESPEARTVRNRNAEKEFLRSIELGNKQAASSHYYLAGIYWGDREYHKAADELELYLKLSPNAPAADRKRAQDAIAELRTRNE